MSRWICVWVLTLLAAWSVLVTLAHSGEAAGAGRTAQTGSAPTRVTSQTAPTSALALAVRNGGFEQLGVALVPSEDQGEIACYSGSSVINGRGKPMLWAATLGRLAMARGLIEAGADVNARDNHGFTPLDAINYDRESARKAKLEIAELLREHGGKIGGIR